MTGASTGLGRSFAELLSEAGTDVVLVARDGDRLSQLRDELNLKYRNSNEILVADLTTVAGIARICSRLKSVTEPIDLLVNNAGLGYTGNFADLDATKHTEQVSLNIEALTQLTHAGAQAMERLGGGTILNVSSIAGDVPGPKSAVYNATKSFVTSFSQSVYIEMRDKGVLVSCLCPGLTRTEFQKRAGYDTSGIPKFLWQEPAAVAQVGLKAAAEGKPVATSGLVNTAWSRTLRTLPRSVSRTVADRLNRK